MLKKNKKKKKKKSPNVTVKRGIKNFKDFLN